jgi:hypothetical protein
MNKFEKEHSEKIKPLLRLSKSYEKAISFGDILKCAISDIKSIQHLQNKSIIINNYFNIQTV